MPRGVTAADLEHSRTWAYRNALRIARQAVEHGLERCERPYLACSGGKDSLVALYLCRELMPEIAVIWSDDELEYPEQPGYIRTIGRDYLRIVKGATTHAGWFIPWQESPYWREPEPQMEWIDQPLDKWSRDHYDAVVLGLRATESRHRRIRTQRFGAVYLPADGQLRINPIQHWTLADVWAYIAANDLPYNPVYDRLSAIGVPREEQRIGPLPLSIAWHLELGWPEMYAGLVDRYGARWRSR